MSPLESRSMDRRADDLGPAELSRVGFGRLLRRRRNVYGFISRPIGRKTLLAILDDSMHVPSAGFTQDCDLVVVRDVAMKKRLAEAAYESEYSEAGHAKGRFISGAPVVVVPCANKKRFEEKYGTPAEENARLPWWLIDAGFASFALILSAFENGLAASFIGALDDGAVASALRLPPDGSIVPLAMVPMGYPKPGERSEWQRKNKSTVRRRRRHLDDYVHWEKW